MMKTIARARTITRSARTGWRGALGVWTGVAIACGAAEAEENPGAVDWRQAAAMDLAAIHDGLEQNSAAAFSGPQGQTFRDWFDKGYAEAKAQLPRVHDEYGYYFLLRGYAGGFRDSHVEVYARSGKALVTPRAWPGFATAWRNGGYVVAWRDDSDDAPPLNAQVISCDGVRVDRLAVQRLDRYDGDLRLAYGRYRTAARLLVDEGNPFVSPPPRSCVFKTERGAKTFVLRYRAPAPAYLPRLAVLPTPGVKFSAQRLAGGVWWLRIPLMQGEEGWTQLLGAVRDNLVSIRGAPLVVMDLRGNYGGSSTYAVRLARLLWGDELEAASEPADGDVLWRVSKRNRDFLIASIEQFKKDPQGGEDVAYYSDLLKRMDAAMAAQRPTFLVKAQKKPPARPLPNPVKGPVVLFTDYWCNSACLDLMDIFTRTPGTVHAGTETNADTIFMEETRIAMPSGQPLTLSFGHKAILGRARKSNETLVPSSARTYRGDLQDDEAVKRWVLSTFGRGSARVAPATAQDR